MTSTSELSERLRNKAKASATINAQAGRRGPEWALENEVEWLAANRLDELEALRASERAAGREEAAKVDERNLIVGYLRHLALLRPADALGLRVAASDIEALFHRDPELNPTAIRAIGEKQ